MGGRSNGILVTLLVGFALVLAVGAAIGASFVLKVPIVLNATIAIFLVCQICLSVYLVMYVRQSNTRQAHMMEALAQRLHQSMAMMKSSPSHERMNNNGGSTMTALPRDAQNIAKDGPKEPKEDRDKVPEDTFASDRGPQKANAPDGKASEKDKEKDKEKKQENPGNPPVSPATPVPSPGTPVDPFAPPVPQSHLIQTNLASLPPELVKGKPISTPGKHSSKEKTSSAKRKEKMKKSGKSKEKISRKKL